MRNGPRCVLITGASRGLGAALALAYAGPETVLLLHGRDADALETVRRRCTEQGAQVRTLRHELRDVAGWRIALAEALRPLPPDLVLVNAGDAATTDGAPEPWETTERLLDVNLRAALATVDVAVAAMRGHGGQLVLVSSLAAWVGMPLAPAYGATKAALKSYGESLRGLLVPLGIGVTVVMPGFVETAMSGRFTGPRPAMMDAGRAAVLIRTRLTGNPARISFPRPLALGLWLLALMPVPWAQTVLARLGFARPRPGRRPPP